MDPSRPPTARERWDALDPGERRAVKRAVQEGGPVEPRYRMMASWYAERRYAWLVVLTALALIVFLGVFVVAVQAASAVTWVVTGVLALSVWSTGSELLRVRRLRDELVDPTDPF